MLRLAIFASGSGTNAENLMQYFQNQTDIEVSCLCTNRSDAFAINRAAKFNIPVLLFNRSDFYEKNTVMDYLAEKKIDWIILAGFLWLVPSGLIDRFKNRIINIHPALLPKYGGKGMYGHHVHQSVIDQKENKSGITIHYIDHEYDKGEIIFQATCDIDASETPESLASKVHDLEYKYFPSIIHQEILKTKNTIINHPGNAQSIP